MDLFNAMRIFSSVVECGSFSAAAAKLDMSPQNVAKTIAQLEKELGMRLISRSTRSHTLTDAGRIYLDKAQAILEAVAEADALVSNFHSEPAGTLKVAVYNTFGIYALSKVLPNWLTANPKVDLRLSVTNRRVDLIEEGYDLAIVDEPLEDGSLICRPITPIRIILAASPAYLERRGKPQTPEDLLRHELLMRPNQRTWRFLDHNQSPIDIHPVMKYVSDNCQISAEMAVAGLGITKQPYFRLKSLLNDGALVEVLPRYPVPCKTLCAIFPHRRLMPLKVRSFINFLNDTFGRTPL